MGLDVLSKMLSKLLLLCRIFTVSGAVSLLFLPFFEFFFFSLWKTQSPKFFTHWLIVTFSCSQKKNTHNSVPWFCVGFYLLLEMSSLSCVTAPAGAVQPGKCVPGLLPNGAGPPCHFSHLSGPPLQIFQRMIDCFCPKVKGS